MNLLISDLPGKNINIFPVFEVFNIDIHVFLLSSTKSIIYYYT